MMRRKLFLIPFVVCCIAGSAAAQSSQFGVRGLGNPGRGLSVEALATEGAIGLFSAGSVHNPAALADLRTSFVQFTSTQEWRTTRNPVGSGSVHTQRFPLVMVGGPVPGSRFKVGVSFSNYTDRDYLLVSTGTASPRGVPVAVTDSIGSTGGLSDFRLATSYTLRSGVHLGVGLHLLTGSNRLFSNRAWADSSYLAIRQEAELSYLGAGLSGGVMLQLTPQLALAGAARVNTALSVERDSLGGDHSIGLPMSVSAGVRWSPSPRLSLAGNLTASSWSRADAGVVQLGGLAARNSVGVAAGLEWSHNLRHPDRFPLRLGVRRTELPFLLQQGSQPRELGVAIGTGLRFANGVGGLDLSVERVHRSEGSEFSENAWHLSIGVSLRGIPSN